MFIYSLLFSAFAAHAYPAITCQINETGASKSKQTLVHPFTNNGHDMTHFQTETSAGFVAVSRGYLVVNISNTKTNAVSNFHGYILDGKIVGGAMHSPETNTWIEVSCQMGQ